MENKVKLCFVFIFLLNWSLVLGGRRVYGWRFVSFLGLFLSCDFDIRENDFI